jgi:large subunit ribosomal protein L21
MYAIVKTGGKQYRVERGQSLLVERLPVEEGKTCSLEPLLVVDGDKLVDSGARVEARVLAHERGPKLRVVKFKPKRGYRRRTGHRQELTRIEITTIEAGGRGSRARAARSKGESSASGARARVGRERSGSSARGRSGSAEQGGSAAAERSASAAQERSNSARGARSSSAPRKRPPTKKEDTDGS